MTVKRPRRVRRHSSEEWRLDLVQPTREGEAERKAAIASLKRERAKPAKRPHVAPAPPLGNETGLQLTVAAWLRLAIPKDVGWFFHVPNQGKRAIATHQLFKAMGMVPGIADLVIALKLHGSLGMAKRQAWVVGFLELKEPKAKSMETAMSDAQLDFRDHCDTVGHPYACVNTLEGAQAFLVKLAGLAGRSSNLRAVK